MVLIEIDLRELKGLVDHLSVAEVNQRVTLAVKETAAKIAADAAKDAPRDTGALAASITYDVWGVPDGIWGKVFSSKDYAHDREYGRPPGKYPEKGELLGWMSRKSIPASAEDAIRRSIFVKGSPPTPFLRPALEANQNFFAESLFRHLFEAA